MFGKKLRFMTMVGLAAAVPYAWYSDQLSATWQGGWQSWQRLTSGSSRSDHSSTTWPISIPAVVPGSGGDFLSPQPAAVFQQLSEVVRFDVTPQWVTNRWTRISTVRAERDLVGMRVPLVTGTSVADFAGSLTYFFDANQRLRRLTMHGQTGDERQLADYVFHHFGMRPEPHLGAGIYLLRWNAKPMNVMRVSHAPVIRAEEPHAKLIIELEINDVHGGYGVSPEFAQLLVPDQQVRRW